MRAFFLPSRGDVNAPARSVEQPAASHVPSSLEQPADSFTSINALTVWLKAQGDESSPPELGRLRAAVAVLVQKPKPKQANVRPLCSAWDVQRNDGQRERPLPTLIAELRARGPAAQLGGSASSETGEETSAAQAGSTASSAEQPASINAVPTRVVRPVEFANGKRCLDACTSCESGEDTMLHSLAQRPSSGA